MDRTRLWIAAMVYPMANAVMFGSGATLVLMVPWLNQNAAWSLPVTIVLALVLAAPVSWVIAPRLRRRYWKYRAARDPKPFDAVVDEVAK